MRLLVAAGASGGGVYPALAVLQELGNKDVELLWVGGEGGMEEDLVTRAGYQLTTLPAAGLHAVGLAALPGNLWQLARGYLAARRLLREWRPDVLFFTGGFVAAPVALAGRGIPTLAFVPDAKPGRALRLAAYFADSIAVVSESLRSYFGRGKQLLVTGYPLRAELTRWAGGEQRAAACQHFSLEAGQPVLLVFGGSKGAQSINRAVLAALPDLLQSMQVLHISGQGNWAEVQAAQEQLPPRLAVRYRAYPYLHEDMGAAFAAADLGLCRAGASTLGELPAFGLPAVLVPLPHETNMVQHANAAHLGASGGAIVMEDAEMPARLGETLLALMHDEPRRKRMAAAMRALAVPGAAGEIAGHLRRLGGLRS